MKAIDEKYMAQCLLLAKGGRRLAMPNPSVGALVVYNNKVIGEGSTSPYGESHAEVHAINSVKDKSLLKKAKIYVTLEPCSHFGKTPPCIDLILKHGIPTVIIGNKDPNELVNGKGIEKLKSAGINVVENVLEKECYWLNRRFFTFHKHKRPYVILKWAQTKDGFIDKIRTENEKGIFWISNLETKELTHKWRAEEAAICVGTNTVDNDNPFLTVREVLGKNPLRIVIDRKLILKKNASVFNSDSSTLVLNEKLNSKIDNLEYITVDFNNLIQELMNILYKKNIMSVIIEGGKQTLQSFLNENVWDEARVISGNKRLNKGVGSPIIPISPNKSFYYGDDLVNIYNNTYKNEKFK